MEECFHRNFNVFLSILTEYKVVTRENQAHKNRANSVRILGRNGQISTPFSLVPAVALKIDP
jgi:hypothetical protein